MAEYHYDGAEPPRHEDAGDLNGTTATDYYYNTQWQLLEERTTTAGTNPTTSIDQYVWSARYIDAPVVQFHDANGDGDVSDPGDATLLLHRRRQPQRHGPGRDTSGHGGRALRLRRLRQDHGVYGNDSHWHAGRLAALRPPANEIRYAGYMFDAETGNYLARHRYYSVTYARGLAEIQSQRT